MRKSREEMEIEALWQRWHKLCDEYFTWRNYDRLRAHRAWVEADEVLEDIRRKMYMC